MGEADRTTRRRFLGQAALGASATLLPAAGSAAQADAAALEGAVTVAGYPTDRMRALIDGSVLVGERPVAFELDKIGLLNTHVFDGPGTRDATEIGLHPFMLAWANGGFRGYRLLPVFPLRAFRHKSIFVRTDRGIDSPADLEGKKVATPGFSSTSLTWIRGVLEDEYGVSQEDVEWYVSDIDSAAADSGSPSEFENMMPEGLTVRQGPEGKDESQMLDDGDVDALFHAAEPKSFVEGDPGVARLFPDFRAVEQDYYRRTGIFPVMHAVAIRDASVEADPGLPEALFKAFSEAKAADYAHQARLGWVYSSLPWYARELETTRELMGDNYWPYGIEPNRKAIEALFRYSYEQGLAKKLLTIEELFHPATLELTE